jgi:uncharacterized membrane protein YqiK
MGDQIIVVVIAVGILGLIVLGILVIVARFYQKVDQGKALIVNTMKSEPYVTFTGAVVYPIIHRSEIMDISVKTIEITRRGKDGLICKDNIRADISVNFFVRVNKKHEDVLKVAQSIGCQRASDKRTLEELFVAKFSEALKTVGKRFDFSELYSERNKFKDEIVEVIGQDLNGYVLDDAAIDYLEQTPLTELDENNIMDADGIRKITELTVKQNLQTNELRQKERMERGSQNLTSDEAIFNFERRRAEAEARKEREIQVVQAKEQNEAVRISEEEVKRTRLLREKNEEEAQIAAQNRERAVAVVEKIKQRDVLVEAERVEKARALEAISREREVELQRIAKEKELEEQRKQIADIVRGRVAVEKTVAQEQENIKDVHALAEANRQKEVQRIAAEAKAQENLVVQKKAAETSEEVARFKARERLVTAEAELEAADKQARAKIRLAEGQQAEEAAAGLAAARVIQEKMLAEAQGEEKKGLARVRVKEAEAAAIEKQGAAEAAALQAKMLAEATGIAAKAQSMAALQGASKEHEEYRLALEKDKAIALEGIHARRQMAEAQARVLAEALHGAKFHIVGGDGSFFERFTRALSFGQSIDGAVDQSQVLRTVFSDYLSGQANLPQDLKEILASPSLSAENAQRLTLAAFLAKVMNEADAPTRSKLQALLSQAQKLGLHDVKPELTHDERGYPGRGAAGGRELRGHPPAAAPAVRRTGRQDRRAQQGTPRDLRRLRPGAP